MKVSEIREWKFENGWYINPENGNGVRLGNEVTLGNWVTLGNGVIILPNIKIPDGMNGLTFQMSWYPCTVCGDKITSGCYVKTVDEWIEFLTDSQAEEEKMPDFVVPYYQAFFKWVKQILNEGG